LTVPKKHPDPISISSYAFMSSTTDVASCCFIFLILFYGIGRAISLELGYFDCWFF